MTRLIALAIAALIAAALGAQAAPATFFGEDLNDSGSRPLKSTPNADSAKAEFLSYLKGTSTEDFEAFKTGTKAPLELSFTGSAGKLTATLFGGGGLVSTVTPGNANGVGRYATSGSNILEVDAGSKNTFVTKFGTPIAAFGFHGIDVGDFGGTVELDVSFANDTVQTVRVPTTEGSRGSTDGSVFYFGYIVDQASALISSVAFKTSTGEGDVFAFDDFTIGDRAQVSEMPMPSEVPIPGALPLLASGIGAVAMLRRRRAAVNG